jgi:lysophospholipase L1-like esterase
MILKKIQLILLLMISFHFVRATPSSDSVIVTNAGKNGNSTRDLLKRVNRDVIARKPQVVVLMIGTNDIFYPKKAVSLETYENNLQKLISSIREESELVLMTIPPAYAPYIILRKPELHFKSKEEVDARVDSVNAIITRLAFKNKCTLLDLNKILIGCGGPNTDKEGLFQNEANFGIKDGVHPTASGARVIAATVYLIVHTLKPNVKSIVCFGDSITRGYRLDGEGSSEGETYPAILKRIFNLK